MVGFLRAIKPAGLGAAKLFSFIIRNWYFFILLIVLLPTVISSINQAVDEKNPIIPFVQLGLVLINADAQIAEDVRVLKENPAELIGVQKPTKGIWKNVVYYFNLSKIIFREMGLIWAIFFPFIAIYRWVIKPRNKSESAKNVFLTAIFGMILIFITNLLIIVRGFITGELISSLPDGISLNQQIWLIVVQALPFHGLLSLVQYLISLNTLFLPLI